MTGSLHAGCVMTGSLHAGCVMTVVSQASPLLTTAPDVLHHRHAKRGSGDSLLKTNFRDI
jgi:hypothetical protein